MLSLLEKALGLVDRARLEQRLVEMVDIYSPPGDEADILAYLERLLETHGLSFKRQSVEGGHHNLLVQLGSGKPEFCLMGHVDTIFLRHMDDHSARRTDGRIA
ncbi:MAG: M20 family peptidase, partial [Myxococcales bacterium]|nr:M20 family peptidase [Myxococcales bacterium]